jgi:alkylation response protein AidB-like acyl-CoA dehydrogenase
MPRRCSEEQATIRMAAHDFLRANYDFTRVRRIMASAAGWDPDLWYRFAADLGFAGLAVPAEYGGSGLGPAELALVAEELGGVLAPIPWFETSTLAANTLLRAGATGPLAEIAGGGLTATLAWRDAQATPFPHGIGPRIANGMLSGTAHFVPFGATADLLIIAAREEDVSLTAIPRDTSGLRVEALVTMDLTRPLAHLHFDNLPISNLRAGMANSGALAMEHSLCLANAVLAAEQMGGMQRTLDEAVAYAQQRVQFGRLIGSFQAMKHRMADMKLKLEAARTAVAWAISALCEAAPDAAVTCAATRAYCTDAFLEIAAEGIQLHGGIGFTWDHHAHLFFKRARGSATLLDPPAILRERIAAAILDHPLEGAA